MGRTPTHARTHGVARDDFIGSADSSTRWAASPRAPGSARSRPSRRSADGCTSAASQVRRRSTSSSCSRAARASIAGSCPLCSPFATRCTSSGGNTRSLASERESVTPSRTCAGGGLRRAPDRSRPDDVRRGLKRTQQRRTAAGQYRKRACETRGVEPREHASDDRKAEQERPASARATFPCATAASRATVSSDRATDPVPTGRRAGSRWWRSRRA